MGSLGRGRGAVGADRAAEAAELTSRANWRRVTAAKSVLAVRELMVARRSPGERGSKDADTPVAAGGPRRGRAARRRGPGGGRLRAPFGRGPSRGGAGGAGDARGRSRSRSVPARRARLLYGPAAAPRVAVTSALSVPSRILKHLRNARWRGLLPSASPGSVAPFFFFFFLVRDPRKQSSVFPL